MIIYLCPALIDGIGFLFLFAVTYGAGERGMTITQCAWLSGVFQLLYMVCSPAVGMLLSRRNAKPLVLAGTILCTASGVACLLLKDFWPLIVAMGAVGVSLAVFFNSFQTFMRGEAPPGGLSRSVGVYTLAWSTGAALGFLSSAYFYHLGMVFLSVLTLLTGGVVIGVLATHKPRSHDAPSADEHVEQGPRNARRVDSAYVWVGWLMIMVAMAVQRSVQTFFPTISAQQGISPLMAGLPLFLQMALQAVVGFSMVRFRHVLYRRTPLIVLHLGAAAVFLAVWWVPSFLVSTIGLSVLGIYAGFAYFAAVYYASNSGRRSFNIGVNEFLVGLGSVGGLFVNQWWMKRSGSNSSMYAVCALMLVAALAAQLIFASRAPSEKATG